MQNQSRSPYMIGMWCTNNQVKLPAIKINWIQRLIGFCSNIINGGINWMRNRELFLICSQLLCIVQCIATPYRASRENVRGLTP